MRIFYATTDACCELKCDNFLNEEEQHKWVESNLQRLFPNLELIKSKMHIAKKIPDTVAFDHDDNTFVAIEYKNELGRTVRDQAKVYLNTMEDNRDTLVLTYNEQKPQMENKRSDSFNWGKMYVVIIAPKFTDMQIGAAKKDTAEILYKLRRFENGIVTLQHVGGGHARIDDYQKTVPKETSSTKTANNDNKAHIDHKNTFYATVRDKILSTFPGIREHPTKLTNNFKHDNGRTLCSAVVQKKQIAMFYGRRGDLPEDDFTKDVSNIGHLGNGNYRSNVKNESDLERLLSILKKLK